MGGFNFNDLGRELQGGFQDIGNALNPINSINQISGTVNKGIDTVGGIANKGLNTISSLVDFLPLILIAGGALFILTKK